MLRTVVCGLVVVLGMIAGSFVLSPATGQDRTEERLSDLETRVAVLETAVAEEPEATEAPRESEEETPEATQEDRAAAGEGDQDSPLPFGEGGKVGDYEIRVVEVTPNATELVMEENTFNEPPDEGNQFYMVRVEVTYTGSDSGDPAFDLSFQAVGERNQGYDFSNADCGVVPEQAYDVGELFEGATAEFNVCWEIVSEDAESLVMYVDPLFSFEDDERVWFSLNEE